MRTFTPRVEHVLSSADELAAEWGHDYIGTEHLLLALLADRDGIAAHVLRDLGVVERTVQRLEQIMNSAEYNRPSRWLGPRQGTSQLPGEDSGTTPGNRQT